LEKKISIIPDFEITSEGFVQLRIPKNAMGYVLEGSFVTSIHRDCIVLHLSPADWLAITVIEANDGEKKETRIVEHNIGMIGFSNGLAMWFADSEVNTETLDDLPICPDCWNEMRAELRARRKPAATSIYS
jgi:hypothetical protein